jgi:hypothetical protein
METLKRCSKCKKSKPLEEFCKSKNGKYGHHHYCKLCLGNQQKKVYKKLKEKRKIKAISSRYKISIEELNGLYTEKNCAICQNEFKSKRTTLIDHDHSTGKIRGLLCPKCNNLLGSCNDNIEVLKSAINYLELSQIKQ